MRKVTSYLVLLFVALFVYGCSVISPTKGATSKSYMSVTGNVGKLEYITFNEIDHQFYFLQNWWTKAKIIGTWDVCKDTLNLHPALMYEYDKDTIAGQFINLDTYEKAGYCPLKFLMRGRKGEILEDITDYSDVIQYALWYDFYKNPFLPEDIRDSVFKDHLGEDSLLHLNYKNDFILSYDYEITKKKWREMQEKEKQKTK